MKPHEALCNPMEPYEALYNSILDLDSDFGDLN